MIHLVIPPATVESEVSSGLTPGTSAAHWSDFRKAGSLRDLVPSWYDTMSESLSLPLQSAASQVLKNLDLEACPESCFPGNLMLKWRIPQREVQCLAAVRRLMPLRKFSLWRGTTTAFTLHLSMQGSWKALICQKSWKELKLKKKHVKSQESKLTKNIWGKKATNVSNNAWVNQSSANLVLWGHSTHAHACNSYRAPATIKQIACDNLGR